MGILYLVAITNGNVSTMVAGPTFTQKKLFQTINGDGMGVVLMVDFYKRIIVTVVLFLFSILTSSVKPRSPFPHHPWLG